MGWHAGGGRRQREGVQLEALGLSPMLHLGMRLGEGTGAALAFPLLDAAAAILREMATFASAGVAGRSTAAAPSPDAVRSP